MAFRPRKNQQEHAAYTPHDNGSVAQGAPKKKKKKWLWPLLAILALIIIIASCSSKGDDKPASNNTSSPAASQAPAETQQAAPESSPASEQTTAAGDTQTVELEATATSTGNVMHGAMGSTNTEQFSGQWAKSVPNVKKSDGYSLTVTGDIMDQTSKVTCKIIVNGKVEDEAAGSGAGGGATCTLAPKFW